MIAFLVLAHDDPEQVQRLVQRLRPHDVYLHLDRKTKFDARWRCIDATFIEDRVPVYWAGFSQVLATENLLRAALASDRTYDRIVLLSGSCYPVRPIEELEAYFAVNSDLSYIAFVDAQGGGHLPTLTDRFYFRDGILPWRLTSRSRVARSFERLLRKLLEIAFSKRRKSRPTEWANYHGSAYWALTDDCARHVLSVIDSDIGSAMKRYFRSAFASDEHFFHTIVGNSRFSIASTGLQPYRGRGTYRMANLHIIDPSLAKWYTLDDLPELVASGMYFVRKVRSASSASLIDALDARDSGTP